MSARVSLGMSARVSLGMSARVGRFHRLTGPAASAQDKIMKSQQFLIIPK